MDKYNDLPEKGLMIVRLMDLTTYVHKINGKTYTQTIDKAAKQRILRRLYRDIMRDASR